MSGHETGADGGKSGICHVLVPFGHHVQPSQMTTMTLGKREMSPKKSEAERTTAKAAPALAKHYRAIGPAAIVAALICAPKKKPAKAAKAA